MLEIDGEFFEDPCEKIIASRLMVVQSIYAAAQCQALLVLTQPLFPPKFVEAGDFVCIPGGKLND